MKHLLTLFFLLAICATSCKAPNKVVGGSARHETGGFAIDYFPPGGGRVALKDDRETVATTQPSIQSSADVTNLRQNNATEGNIGGFSFDTKNLAKPNVWPLLLIFGGIAAVGWFIFRSPAMVAVGGAGLVLTILWPNALAFIALGVVGVAIFLFIKHKRDSDKTVTQIVTGNQNAVAALPEIQQAMVKNEWDKAQDTPTKQRVAVVKSKLATAGVA